MFLLALVPQTPHTEELLNALYANAGIAGLGLLLTAIIQTAQGQLSLFHAIFILHILYFLGTGASPMGECSVIPRSLCLGSYLNPGRLQVNTTGPKAESLWAFSYSSPRSSHSQDGACTSGSTWITTEPNPSATTKSNMLYCSSP